MALKNNYAAQSVFGLIEGLSALGFVSFLFFNLTVSGICLAAFIVAIPLRNYAKWGKFYPGPLKEPAAVPIPTVSPLSPLSGTSEPLREPVAPQPAKTI